MSTEAITRSDTSGTGDRGGDQSAMGDVAATAKEAAATAKEEAATVVHTVKDQVQSIASDVKNEVRLQAEDRAKQAASKLQTLSDQLEALVGGRPQEAGPFPEYVREGQQKVRAFATRLEQRGPQGVIDDAVSFGRRRPGAFLAIAAGLGFAVGRLARAGVFEQTNATSQPSGSLGNLSQPGGTSTGASTGTTSTISSARPEAASRPGTTGTSSTSTGQSGSGSPAGREFTGGGSQ